MKNIKSLILISIIGMLSYAQFAFGQETARAESYLEGANSAISPYAQAALNDSYTFIGISHPSLTTAAARIGVAVEVMGMNTLSNTQAARSAVFTVNGGETHRVFVVSQSHASINSANTAFQDSRTHLIPVADTAQFGAVRVTTVHEDPTLLTTAGTLHTAKNSAGTGVHVCNSYANMLANPGCGYATLNQLTMWGIVYSEAAGTGFAMEFIGDMQDSLVQTGLNRGFLKLGTRGGQNYIAAEPYDGGGHRDEAQTSAGTSHRPGAGVN